MPWMALFIIVVGIMFAFFLVFLFSSSSSLYIIPPGTEEIMFKERFLGDCFLKPNELTGEFSSVIDWDKFDQEHLNECYNIGEESRQLGFRLRLKVGDEEKAISTRNWKEKPVSGEGQEVNVWKNNEQLLGDLLIEVQDAK